MKNQSMPQINWLKMEFYSFVKCVCGEKFN